MKYDIATQLYMEDCQVQSHGNFRFGEVHGGKDEGWKNEVSDLINVRL